MKGVTKVFIVHVHVHVKPECVDEFRVATLENAQNSVREPGVARFDVLQQQDDPTRFVLVEAYRTPEDPAEHKETLHYQTWRDTVADLMAEPRAAVKYDNVFPEDAGW
jgi:quinol monooxygenase YgiN